ncbi:MULTISPECIES: response regulator [Clostridium]|uniref:Stage 0 sporulation protein A homolog n=1 Tax=Clostridium cibarium TaxID=2762247 RepID=A0ABR8PTX9_9CLOT|nr:MULTISPECIES: response regulator [Clostridium]MBD7911636.1 response regulator [Clostridium cibarium]
MSKEKINIIIIDDDLGIVESLKSFLEEECNVEGFTDSVEGLARLQEKSFDLLILDYYIDKLNGADIVKEIRKFNNNIYILILTGYSESVPGLTSLENLDIQNYCEKTADFDKILIQIKSIIKSIKFFKDQDTTGGRLKQLRKVNRLSQEDVAKYLGVQISSISQYESNLVLPPTQNILKLAKLFNVTTDFILCYELDIRKN